MTFSALVVIASLWMVITQPLEPVQYNALMRIYNEIGVLVDLKSLFGI
jgi:hypothetical protein